jgi:hypothetical protein
MAALGLDIRFISIVFSRRLDWERADPVKVALMQVPFV